MSYPSQEEKILGWPGNPVCPQSEMISYHGNSFKINV